MSNFIEKDTIPFKNPNFLTRNEDDGVLFYDRVTKRKFFANDTAKKIIENCNGKNNILRIFSKIYLNNASIKNYKEFCNFLEGLIFAGIIRFNNKTKYNRSAHVYPYDIPNITKVLKAPLHVYWEITYRCNLNCEHCYVKDRKIMADELKTKECLKIIDDLAELKVFEITFSGGEPLIRKDLIEMIRYATKNEIAALLTTNGTLIDGATARKLKRAGLQAAQVSLDGASPITHDRFRGVPGSYSSAVKGIKNLVKAKIPVIIATIPTKSNFSEIPKILKLARKLKVQGYRILECKPFGRGENSLKNTITFRDYVKLLNWVVKEREKIKDDFFILLSESFGFQVNRKLARISNIPLIDCPAGRSMCAISPDGFVSACSYFAFVDLTLGDLRHKRIKEIWQRSRLLQRLRKLDFSKGKNNGKCLNCEYSLRCGRGCRALAYQITKKLIGLDPRCLKNKLL